MYFLKLVYIKKMHFRAAVTLTHKCMIHLTCYHYCRLAYCLTPVVKRIDKNALRIFPHSLHPSLEEVILIDKDMLNSILHSQIAQAEISMSVAFPTHVWEMANICKHIIVWFFSHTCAFSHTYVSKSKHV